MGQQFLLPDEIHDTDNESITGTSHLILHLQNQTYPEKFTFNKNHFLGSLIVLNERLSETFAVTYHTDKSNRRKNSKVNDNIL